MRTALWPLMVAVLLPSISIAAPAPATTVDAAKKGLETARSNLAIAMKKVEGDAPTTADLDAAHAVVNALKDAIDAGASQEPNDLDYAKAALAARKELREKRDYVDQRRAKVHIFNHRRTIDAALAVLKDKAKATEAKEPGPTAFDDVRSAVVGVRKAADEARQFSSQDAAFASYLTELDATTVKIEKASDERWALLEGDKHRAKVEEARAAYASAMGSLSASSSDDQFKAADTAGKLLATRLDEGKVLEGKDKNYGAYAAKTKSELATSKKKSDDLWSQTGLTRLKAEIAPAAKDLQGALKIVRSKKPDADQLAEARTTAIIVRKLLEKFEPEAQRSAAFGDYVNTVKGNLVEVENGLQLRALDIAQRDFRNALVKLDKKAPSDDDFAVANSALLVLDKTLEPMNAKDPALVQPVADAKAWQRDGKATITRRRLELDNGAITTTLATAVKDFRAALGKIEQKAPTDDDFSVANSAALVLDKTLEPIANSKDPALAQPLADAKAWQRDGKATLARRRLELDNGALISSLNTAVKDFRNAIAKVERKGATDDDFSVANSAALVLDKTLEPLANSKDPALTQPIADAKAWQRDGKATIARRRLELDNGSLVASLNTAVKDFRNALAKLEKKAPSDDDFAVANSSALVLDKTIEPITNSKDPALTQPIVDAKAWQREGKATITRRRLELDIAAQQAKVEEARRKADTIITDFAKPESGDAQVKEAEAAVADIGKTLDGGTELTTKDKPYAAYDREVRKRMNDLTAKITARKLALTVAGARAELTELLATAKTKLETSRLPASTDADLALATKAVEAVNSSLEAKAELETKSGGYAASAEKARIELMRRLETLEISRNEREVRKRTIDTFVPGETSADAAAASNDMRLQKREYEKAANAFKACKEDGSKMLEQNPQVGRLAVVLGGLPSTVKDVVGQCSQKYDAVSPLIKPLAALIQFEDGPRKAYELAVQLLAKGKKTEALAQFDECTATAVTLSVRNPDLRERSFTVDNKQMTLAELSKVCTAKSRELLGKK